MLEIRMLGQFDVRLDGRVTNIPSRPAQSLLAYLALSAGTVHRREKLAGLFWPDSTEANARSSLRHALWRIRKEIDAENGDEDPHLLVDSLAIGFADGEHTWVDALVMAQEPSGAESLDNLTTDLSLYGGDLLPGFYDDWVILERGRLRAVFDQKMQIFLDRCLANHRWPLVLEWAERWITLGEVPEPAYRALMIAYNGLGDSARVAATFRRCREALMTELGVQPSEQTQDTYAWLVEGGPPPAGAVITEESSYTPAAVDAVENLLERWSQQDLEILDVASLALIHRTEHDHQIQDRYAPLLIRSALHHNVDVNPWVARLGSPKTAVNALVKTYESYQEPPIRRRIVDALRDIVDGSADDALRKIVLSESDPPVRESAAIIIARRGQGQELMVELASQLQGPSGAAAMAAFVAIADVTGRPAGLGAYPKGQVNLALAQRRWRYWRSQIWAQTIWAAAGSGLALGVRGIFEPFFSKLASPETFELFTEIMRLSAAMFGGLLIGLLLGALHGAATGFAVGLSDAMDPHHKRPIQRLLFGAVAGLVYAMFMIIFALLGFKAPSAESAIFIPLQTVFGLLYGASLTLVVPRLGWLAPVRQQLFLVGQAMVIITIITLAFNSLAYRPIFWISVSRDLASYLAQLSGVALILSEWNRRYQRTID